MSLKDSLNEIVILYIIKRMWQFLKLYINALLKLTFRKLIKANEMNVTCALIIKHCANELKEAL